MGKEPGDTYVANSAVQIIRKAGKGWLASMTEAQSS
jgi:hypothetical protein